MNKLFNAQTFESNINVVDVMGLRNANQYLIGIHISPNLDYMIIYTQSVTFNMYCDIYVQIN